MNNKKTPDGGILQAVMQSIEGGVSAFQLKGGSLNMIFCNDKYYELYGYDRGESPDIIKLIVPEDRNNVLRTLAALKAVKKPVSIVYRCRRRNGSIAFLHSTASLTDMDGYGSDVITTVVTDITESREAYARLKLMIDGIPGGLATYACTSQGIRIIYCNSGFEKLFGMTIEDYRRVSAQDPIVFLFDEDRAVLADQYHALMADDTPIDCVYRIHIPTGYKWIHHRAVTADRHNDTVYVNAALFDITDRQESLESLRISEEENRLAIAHSGNIITKFDVRKRTLSLPVSLNPIFDLPPVLNNMPMEQIDLGRVSPETKNDYIDLFEGIVKGSPSGTATFQQNSTKGWRWLEAQYTTVFSSDGNPASAVITFVDVTEQLEKEVVYSKWQQSLMERSDDSYTLFRCNLSKGNSFDSREGSLIQCSFSTEKGGFSQRTAEYVSQCVYGEDKGRYLAFINVDTMLASYYRGHRSDFIEYREINAAGEIRWLRLSVDLVEYPNSKDIEVYLMFEDIDRRKKEELLTLERSETDALTGVLNRATFISRLEQALQASPPGERHCLFMLDVDEFKLVNDTLGHGAGDYVLRELTSRISAVLRRDDLIGRLGGDEFFVFLRDIPDKAAAEVKARQICAMKLRTPDSSATVTVSIGIVMIPDDGADFDALYKKADTALYQEKRHGKNGFMFYGSEI